MDKIEEIEAEQKQTCARYGAVWTPAPRHLKFGIALNARSTLVPINGLRHPPEGDTTGWYIWAGEGELSSDPDFFVPLHVAHLAEWRPEILRFLGLPPGWRFLTDGTYEDVWEDSTLFKID
jgi:hypothetical protein